MQGVLVITVIFGALAVPVAFSRWLAGRRWAAAGNLLVALLLFTFARVLWPAATNLASYQPMAQKGPVAQVFCERTGPGIYRVTLTRLPAGRMQLFEMAGDEWRLDIRTLAWRENATRLGLAPGFRLDRLSARFLSSVPPGTALAAAPVLPSGYHLSDADEPGEDVWAQARTGSLWQQHADAGHVYSAWRPLAHGGRYDLWLTHEGGNSATLDARPANDAAAKAVQARERARQAVAAR
jgi:hypothetical protein